MNILGIETSCDDTGVAILKIQGQHFPPQTKIIANLISSQVAVHRPWGGVVPNLAKREHQKHLLPLLQKALQQFGQFQKRKIVLQEKERAILEPLFQRNPHWGEEVLAFLQISPPPKIDYLAVTQGPGLAPALWTGIIFAQALSSVWKIPLIPVNHLEGHILSCWLPQSNQTPKIPNYPLVALVVSGGHTQLVLVKDFGHYQILGETRDDAAGECFDKTARVLKLGYPGGPPIAQAAKKWQNISKKEKAKIPLAIREIKLPRPMIYAKNFDFSFSGLKTAVFYLNQKLSPKIKKSPFYPLKMADEIQKAINDVLVKKTIKAAQFYQAKGVVLGGGVSANQQLKERLQKECQLQGLSFFKPSLAYAMDNAVMIAFAAYFHQKEALSSKQILQLQANANLSL